MARKEIIFTLQDAERTLKFKARQMPATKLEMFIIKLAAVALHGGIANSFNGLPEGKGISDINWRDVNIDEVFNVDTLYIIAEGSIYNGTSQTFKTLYSVKVNDLPNI